MVGKFAVVVELVMIGLVLGVLCVPHSLANEDPEWEVLVDQNGCSLSYQITMEPFEELIPIQVDYRYQSFETKVRLMPADLEHPRVLTMLYTCEPLNELIFSCYGAHASDGAAFLECVILSAIS